MRLAAGGIVIVLAACATATQPQDAGALYAQGQLVEAQQALASGPRSPQTDLLRCRLELWDNRAAQSLSCLAQLSDQTSRSVLSLRAEAEKRLENFTGAAAAYRKLGDQAHAEEFEYLAAHRPTGWDERTTHVINFLRTDPLPVAQASVGSSPPCNFLLDTGAADTVLDPKLAAKTRAVVFGAEKGTFAGGKQAGIGHGVVASFQVGDLTIRNLPVDILDVSNFRDEAGKVPICGVIGTGLLSHFVATIDYPKGRLVLESKTSRPAGGRSVRIWLAGDHYILAMGQINNGPQRLFLVDSGLAGGGFAAPEATLIESGLAPGSTTVKGEGGGGTVEARPFVVSTLAVGPVEQHNVAGFANVFPPPLEHAFGTHIAGLVSHQFFRSYAVTFDFGHMVLHISR